MCIIMVDPVTVISRKLSIKSFLLIGAHEHDVKPWAAISLSHTLRTYVLAVEDTSRASE